MVHAIFFNSVALLSEKAQIRAFHILGYDACNPV